ncbi:hypothetical protein JGH11_05665 [Dysgonomonas sp. Marseille-P4677]|uniref:PKD-like family lipoprotein n=1 Tax=Dysgonomonas sp. Marseille-P4677 TaxID=2364790 RepID=UPI001912B80F|nr:PKD-like family lipoprotein [Dysgonomonas sp. Marseille-P4677]MBK5720352.1 hypothetical protein [Dysgonomonas sp. Marseille-P4677]
MKKKINTVYYIITSLLVCLYIVSCNEDKGNYTYRDISEAEIENSKVTDTIDIEPNSPIFIDPKVTYSDGVGKGSYTYRWRYQKRVSNNVSYPIMSSSDETAVLDLEQLPLDLRITNNYDVYLQIENNETGIIYQKKYLFRVKNKIQTGYLAISEKKAGVELELVSSFIEDGVTILMPYRSILDFSGSTYLKDGRKPLGIYTCNDATAPEPNDLSIGKILYSVFLLTDQSTDRVNAIDYSFKDAYNLSKISYISDNLLTEGLVAKKMRGITASATATQYYGYISGHWYFASRYMSILNFMHPINRYKGTSTLYKAAPYIGVNASGAVLFNEDENCFMIQTYDSFDDLYVINTTNLWGTTKIIDNEGDAFSFNNKNYELIYMDSKSTNEIFVIVRNKETSDYELLLFGMRSGMVTPGSRIRKVIPQSVDMSTIKRYAFNPSEPIIYMATDDKLYIGLASGANMSVKEITDQLQLPAGHKISCIKNLKSFKSSQRNLLTVATYDPNGDLDTSGALHFFEMNITTGNITLAKHPEKAAEGVSQIDMKWGDFGKIIDIDYKEK